MTRLGATVLSLLLLATPAAGAKKKKPHPRAQPSAPLDTAPPEPSSETQSAAPPPAPEPPSPPPAEKADRADKAERTERADQKVGGTDLDALKAEYDAVRDELFKSRARVEWLGEALYKTRVVALFKYQAQRAWPLRRVVLWLDDKQVFAAEAPDTTQPIRLFEGFAAAGRHVLQVRVEANATGTDRVGYGTEGSFAIDVEAGKQTRVEVSVDETGDGPQSLAKKKAGTLDVRLRADIKQLELSAR